MNKSIPFLLGLILLMIFSVYTVSGAETYVTEENYETGTLTVKSEKTQQVIAILKQDGKHVNRGVVVTKNYIYFTAYKINRETGDLKQDHTSFLYRYNRNNKKYKTLVKLDDYYDYYNVRFLYKNKLYIGGYIISEDTAEYCYDLKEGTCEKIIQGYEGIDIYNQYLIVSNVILYSSDFHPYKLLSYNISKRKLKRIATNVIRYKRCGKYIDALRAKDASKYPGETDSQIIRYDLTNNKSTIIAKSISSYAWVKSTEKYVYYYSPKTEKYYRYTYSNGKVKKITKEKYDSIP